MTTRLRTAPFVIVLLTLSAVTVRRVLHQPAAPLPVGAVTAVAPSGSTAPTPFAPVAPVAPGASTNAGARGGRSLGAITLPLRVRWQRTSLTAIAAGIGVAPDGKTLYVATLGGRLEALATSDGSSRFSFDLGDRSYTAPAVAADGTIYVGSDAGVLCAVRPNGDVRFRTKLPGGAGGPKKHPEIDVAPLLLGDEVVFAAGNVLYRCGRDGAVKSTFAAPGKIFTAPAALPDGTVVFGDQAGFVHGIAADGTPRFKTSLGGPDVDGSPAVFANGDFVIATDAAASTGQFSDPALRRDETKKGQVARLDGRGAILWKTAVAGHVRGPLSIGRDGDVRVGHFASAKAGPGLARLRGGDGAIVSELAIRGTGSTEFGIAGGPPQSPNGYELFGSPHDELVLVGGAGGATVTRIPVDGDVDAPPAVLPSGEVVVATRAGSVYLLAP